MNRRQFLHASGQFTLAGLVVQLMAACSAPAAPSTSPTAPGTAAPTAAPAAPTAAKPAPTAPAAPTAANAAPAAPASIASQPRGLASKLPAYTPIQGGPAPDLPGSPDGLVSPGWIRYPRKALFQSVPTPPGAGGDVTLSLQSQNPPWPPFEQNAQLQAISKALNVKLNVLMIPFSEFDAKWATIQASSDLPDLMCTITRPSTPIVPAFLEAKCQDLTPYLAGDAIRDYPNLAAIPTRSWKSTLINGKIYGVPIPLRPYFWWFWVHKETLEQNGLDFPTSAANFKEIALKVNKPQDNVWAIASEGGSQYAYSTINGLWNGVFKAPNYWTMDSGGRFAYVFETPEYKQAMLYALDLNKAGLYHPNSLSYNTLSARTDFMARKIIFRLDGLQSSPYWGGYNAVPMEPPSHIVLVPPFSADGQGTPVYYFGRPNFGMTLVKKASDTRVKEMLRILNFVAAPFGSIEHNLLFYGVEGKDYAYDDQDNPVLTDQGHAEIGNFGSAWYSLTAPQPSWYSPADPQAAALYQSYEKLLAPMGVEDASIGFFSPTFASKGTILLDGVGGAAQDIIAGRRSVDEWDQVVKDWQNNGGNQIKNEFAASYSQLMSG